VTERLTASSRIISNAIPADSEPSGYVFPFRLASHSPGWRSAGATIEQAKGILIARHAIDQNKAFDLLREHTQRSDRELIDVAEAIVQSHVLLGCRRSRRPTARTDRVGCANSFRQQIHEFADRNRVYAPHRRRPLVSQNAGSTTTATEAQPAPLS